HGTRRPATAPVPRPGCGSVSREDRQVAPLNRRVLDSYPYARNVPPRGLYASGRPPLTRHDPPPAGADGLLPRPAPRCAHDADPAEHIAGRLDDAQPIGRTGMFSTWTGTYRGASVSVVSGGSGSPEAELILHELLENTDATTYLRVGGSGGMHPSVRPG